MLNLKATLVVKQNFFSELMIQGVKSSLPITLTDVWSLWEDPSWCALHPPSHLLLPQQAVWLPTSTLSVKISRKLDYSRYEKGCKVKSLRLALQTLCPNNPMHFLNIKREFVLSCVPKEYYRYITRQFCNQNGLSIKSITSQGNTKAINSIYNNPILQSQWNYIKWFTPKLVSS